MCMMGILDRLDGVWGSSGMQAGKIKDCEYFIPIFSSCKIHKITHVFDIFLCEVKMHTV